MMWDCKTSWQTRVETIDKTRERVHILSDWLVCEELNPCPYQPLSVVMVEEETEYNDTIKSELCSLLIYHLFDIDSMTASASSDVDEIPNDVIRKRLPTVDNMKKGYFGESLTSFLVSEYSGYYIPVKKLHYRISPNQSLPGTDVIGFKVREGAISGICFAESKLRTRYETQIGSSAYKQLITDYDTKQSGFLYFILKILHDKSDPFFNLLMHYMEPLYSTLGNDEFIVSLIIDNSVWSDTILSNIQSDVNDTYPKTIVFAGKINDLENLIDGVYEDIGGINE